MKVTLEFSKELITVSWDSPLELNLTKLSQLLLKHLETLDQVSHLSYSEMELSLLVWLPSQANKMDGTSSPMISATMLVSHPVSLELNLDKPLKLLM